MSNKKTLNIVVIGETGVGKSTFINMFSTYFRHDDIDAAVAEYPDNVLIPTLVTIYDENGQDLEFKVGSNKDQIQEAGCSGTQTVNSYLFKCEGSDFNINLVDTPGMGDTNCVSKDNEHCEMILNELSELGEIHAICFLMRPTNTRNTFFFDYCIKEIMSRLHKSACHNMIFVFTNTRSQNYEPGDTLPGLKRMITAINERLTDVKIKLHKNTNIFCFDNESIKYLVAKHNNVNLNTKVVEDYKQSWDVSKKEFSRLIEYVNTLEPHDARNSVSLNKTRRLISEILKPLSDISDLLQDNIQNLIKNEEEISKVRETQKDLEDKLYITETELEIIQLETPANICTNSSCATQENQSEGVQKWHYKEKCHECPWVGNLIKEESIGHWGLWFCSQIAFNGTCKKCNCSASHHMIIFYETKKHQKSVLVPVVQRELESTESKLDDFWQYMQQVSQRKDELQNELDFAAQCAAKFAIFIKKCAVVPINDAYEGYISLLIKREEYQEESDNLKLEVLRHMLQNHRELKTKFFETSNSLPTYFSVSSQSIEEDIKKLYSCKHIGPKLKEISEKRNKCIVIAEETGSNKKKHSIRIFLGGLTFKLKNKVVSSLKSLGVYGQYNGPNEAAEPATEALEAGDFH
ncbi:uncharacterized protein LOC103314736 [Tribolium castaneum]|uniref:Uncharacterized protein n=1 Tax=Tribolium castaneum TaxID=7070 RepID=D6X2Y4_TRICA|nr:PREDICTED: uncharacterized protein LOC103314736 [Tribolium castaneum]XP_008199700.1 PREDICTED: uncharacterized protein LOC103314736 [Tribolium castaneum]EFA10664.2 hypothetical protein TcasGA2_TC016301 [Tribolium castaneum]|eukprot:XP_008199699.1 PREDICTED: uncharacterized protein LOC103314736 [Tribolium castaneum]